MLWVLLAHESAKSHALPSCFCLSYVVKDVYKHGCLARCMLGSYSPVIVQDRVLRACVDSFTVTVNNNPGASVLYHVMLHYPCQNHRFTC